MLASQTPLSHPVSQLQTKPRVSARGLGMQFAPAAGMGWEGSSLGSGGFAWEGFLSWRGGGPSMGSGGQWGSFAQCVLWVLRGTPSSMLEPAAHQGGAPPHSPPTFCSPQTLTL